MIKSRNNTILEKYFNKKHVGRVELDVLKPKHAGGSKRIDGIIRKKGLRMTIALN